MIETASKIDGRRLKSEPEQIATLRTEVLDVVTKVFAGNGLRQQFLLTRAVKKASEASQ